MAKTAKKQQEEPRKYLSAEEFIRGYMKAKTWAEASEKLDMPEASVRQRVSYLRKKGIELPLKKGNGRGRRLDVDALNKLVEELS